MYLRRSAVTAIPAVITLAEAAALPPLPSINTNNILLITSAPYNAVGVGVTTNIF